MLFKYELLFEFTKTIFEDLFTNLGYGYVRCHCYKRVMRPLIDNDISILSLVKYSQYLQQIHNIHRDFGKKDLPNLETPHRNHLRGFKNLFWRERWPQTANYLPYQEMYDDNIFFSGTLFRNALLKENLYTP